MTTKAIEAGARAYIIIASRGEYTDHYTWIAKVFLDRQSAVTMLENLEAIRMRFADIIDPIKGYYEKRGKEEELNPQAEAQYAALGFSGENYLYDTDTSWELQDGPIAPGELVPASAVAAERERCAAVAENPTKARNGRGHTCIATGRSIASAIRALEPASGEYVLGWRTMDSAPKDGTIILLWYPWTGADLEGAPDGFMYLARWTYKEDGSEAWIDPTDDDEIGDGAIRWMPRPTPPPLTAATSNGSGK